MTRKSLETARVPAGTYWIGDPCYTIPTDEWMEWLDAADYTIDLAAHDFWNDVPSGARVASATLGSKTATNGTADAGDSTFTSVTGDPCEYINIRADTGTESTSRLIGNMDTATGLPVTPNGGNINVAWNASGIFTL